MTTTTLITVRLTSAQVSAIECDSSVHEPTSLDTLDDQLFRAAFLDGGGRALCFLPEAVNQLAGYCDEMGNMLCEEAEETTDGTRQELRRSSESWYAVARKVRKAGQERMDDDKEDR